MSIRSAPQRLRRRGACSGGAVVLQAYGLRTPWRGRGPRGARTAACNLAAVGGGDFGGYDFFTRLPPRSKSDPASDTPRPRRCRPPPASPAARRGRGSRSPRSCARPPRILRRPQSGRAWPRAPRRRARRPLERARRRGGVLEFGPPLPAKDSVPPRKVKRFGSSGSALSSHCADAADAPNCTRKPQDAVQEHVGEIAALDEREEAIDALGRERAIDVHVRVAGRRAEFDARLLGIARGWRVIGCERIEVAHVVEAEQQLARRRGAAVWCVGKHCCVASAGAATRLRHCDCRAADAVAATRWRWHRRGPARGVRASILENFSLERAQHIARSSRSRQIWRNRRRCAGRPRSTLHTTAMPKRKRSLASRKREKDFSGGLLETAYSAKNLVASEPFQKKWETAVPRKMRMLMKSMEHAESGGKFKPWKADAPRERPPHARKPKQQSQQRRRPNRRRRWRRRPAAPSAEERRAAAAELVAARGKKRVRPDGARRAAARPSAAGPGRRRARFGDTNDRPRGARAPRAVCAAGDGGGGRARANDRAAARARARELRGGEGGAARGGEGGGR